jgi:hypothetical protein
LLVVIGSAAPAHSATLPHLWSQRIGGDSNDVSYAVTVDASGNIILAGSFRGVVDFGGGPLTGSAGDDDIFIAKYDGSGAHQWSRAFGLGGGYDDRALAVAVDAAGDVYVTGTFISFLSLDAYLLFNNGLEDVFVAKFRASDGYTLLAGSFGNAGSDAGLSIAVDESDGLLVAGFFSDTVYFGGAPLVSAGSYDVFLAKYSAATGAHQWSQRFGGASTEAANSVAVDAAGNVFLGGHFMGSANFGGAPLVSAGDQDVFLAKYDSGGTHQWSQRFGGTGDQSASSLAVDDSGGLVVTGHFYNTVDFGGGPLSNAGQSDIFVTKHNSAGAHQWSQRFGSTDVDWGKTLAVDAYGTVVVTGSFNGTVSFGGSPLVSAGYDDVFVAAYDSNGAHRRSARFGGTSTDYGIAVATDPAGSIVMTSNFVGTANFGGAWFTSAAGTQDIVLAKYAGDPAEPRILSIIDVDSDQGRKVHIQFARSSFDDPASSMPIEQYEAYRRSDPLTSSLNAGAPPDDGPHLLADWAFVGAVPAHGEGEYEMLAPTLADSTISQGPHYSKFFIRAATAVPSVFFDSPIDSGYSLDNMPPEQPANIAFNSGILSWDDPADQDFSHFTVYGSNTPVSSSPLAEAPSFAAATVIGYTVPPTFDVSPSPYGYYFITASDFSGNEGAPGVTSPLTGLDGTPASYVLSISAHPNPFNPSTTVRYTLPSDGHVTIAVYDARGALVTTIVGEEKPAGAHAVSWNGRVDEHRSASSGIYFARIEAGKERRTCKLVLLK